LKKENEILKENEAQKRELEETGGRAIPDYVKPGNIAAKSELEKR